MKSTFKGGTKMTGGVKRPTPAATMVGGNTKVVAEAKMRKDGGAVPGDKKAMMRLDRPGRKMGGRVGADCSPLSSAATTSKAPG